MNDEHLYASYLEAGADGLDSTALDRGAIDAAARGELDVLRRLLASDEIWVEPQPDLAEVIVAEIRTEREHASFAPVPATRRSRRRAPMLLGAAAAALLAVVAIAGVLATRGGDGGEQFQLAATELVPDASADATVEATGSGLSITLSVEDLPPAAPGTFYQAWMKGPDGSIPIGTFHARDGDGPIELWSGVDAARYPTMTVTIQQEGAGPASSGRVVLTGDIPTGS